MKFWSELFINLSLDAKNTTGWAYFGTQTLFISFLKVAKIMFIAGNVLAGASGGNYCRSDAEKHLTSHSHNGGAQLGLDTSMTQCGGRRSAQNCSKQIDYPQLTLTRMSMAANFNIKYKLSFWGSAQQSVRKPSVMWANCSCPSEGHMIQLSDAKMPKAWLTVFC